MLKIVAEGAGSGRILLLGLSAANIQALQNERPILVNMADLGGGGVFEQIAIIAGSDEATMLYELQRAGFIVADSQDAG